jgi:hypothetical protein
LGVIVGAAAVDAIGAVDTARVKAVLLVMPPPAAVTVIVKFPVGIDPAVAMLRTVEHVGLQEVEEKDPLAPDGSPETVKEVG